MLTSYTAQDSKDYPGREMLIAEDAPGYTGKPREDAREPETHPKQEQAQSKILGRVKKSLWPCSDSSRTPSFPSQLQGKIGLPRANPRKGRQRTWGEGL